MRKNSSLFPCLQESGPVSAPETEGLYNDSQLSWLEVQLVHARHDFTFRFHRQTLSLTPWPFSSWFLGIASTTCSSMNCLFSFSVLILTWYKVKKILLWIPVWEWTHVMCFKDLKPRRKKPDTTFNDFHWRGLNGIDCSKNSWPLLRNEKKMWHEASVVTQGMLQSHLLKFYEGCLLYLLSLQCFLLSLVLFSRLSLVSFILSDSTEFQHPRRKLS